MGNLSSARRWQRKQFGIIMSMLRVNIQLLLLNLSILFRQRKWFGMILNVLIQIYADSAKFPTPEHVVQIIRQETKFYGDCVCNLRRISSLISACLVCLLEPSPLLAMHLSSAPCMSGTRYSLMSRLRWPSEDRPSTSVLLFSFTSSRLMVEGGSTSWPTHTTDTASETFEGLTSLVKQWKKKVKVESCLKKRGCR